MRVFAALVVLSALSCQPFSDSDPKYSENWVEPGKNTQTAGGELLGWVNNGDIFLYQLTVPVVGSSFGSNLIGGVVADPSQWPSTFTSHQGNSGCTATLISKDVLQLAAHCVGEGKTAIINNGTANVTGTCNQNPGYNNDPTADWALCKMDSPVDRTWYEKILQDGSVLSVGMDITQAGVGCTTPGGADGAFGTLRTGTAKIQSLPSADNDTILKGGSALCYGDSGGSAFYVKADQRWVMGVNSRGDIQTTSYESSVFTAAAKSFYKSWSSSHSAKICGQDTDAEKCQGSGPPIPPVPPLPAHCKTSSDFFQQCLFAADRLAIKQPTECRAAYADLFACEEMAEKSHD